MRENEIVNQKIKIVSKTRVEFIEPVHPLVKNKPRIFRTECAKWFPVGCVTYGRFYLSPTGKILSLSLGYTPDETSEELFAKLNQIFSRIGDMSNVPTR